MGSLERDGGMQVTVKLIVLAVVALAPRTPTARAQGRSCAGWVDENGLYHPGCHPGSSSSASSTQDDAASAAAHAAERERLKRIDGENAERTRLRKIELERRAKNIHGLVAAARKQWERAVKDFEAALALNPNDGVVRSNLEQARAELEAERAAIAREQQERNAPVVVAATTFMSTPVEILKRTSPPQPPIEAPAQGQRWREIVVPAVDLGSAQGVLAQAKKTGAYLSAQRVPSGGSALDFVDRINDAAEMKAKYSDLVTRIVDEIAGAAHDTNVILVGGGDGEASVEHVLATPERVARTVYQFVGEQLASQMLDAITGWANARLHLRLEKVTTP